MNALMILILSTTALATEDAPAPDKTSVKKESASEAESEGPQKTVVAGFAAKRGVEKELADALSQIVVNEVSKRRSDVITRDDMSRLLDLEGQKQAMGCDESECLSEIASALNAERVVSGTLSVVGNTTLVELVELRSGRVEPLQRLQQQVGGGENALVDAVRSMAKKLASKELEKVAGTQKNTDPSPLNSSVVINSDPPGSRVMIDGLPLGNTPLKLNIKEGRRDLVLLRKNYDNAAVTFRAYANSTTKIDAQMVTNREVAEANFAARLQKFRQVDRSHSAWMWTKGIGGGALIALGGAALFSNQQGAIVGGLVLGAAGAGFIGWAIIDRAKAPKPPIPEWEQSRTLTVTPAPEYGDPVVTELSKDVRKDAE